MNDSNGMDFYTTSPDYQTTPLERLTAYLTADLQRHYPQEEFHAYGLAQSLAHVLAEHATTVNLSDYPARQEHL